MKKYKDDEIESEIGGIEQKIEENPPPEEEDDTGVFSFGNKLFQKIDLFAYAQHGNWGSWYYGTPVSIKIIFF